jgi:hypothetical protein
MIKTRLHLFSRYSTLYISSSEACGVGRGLLDSAVEPCPCTKFANDGREGVCWLALHTAPSSELIPDGVRVCTVSYHMEC